MRNSEKFLSFIVFAGICAAFLMPFIMMPVLYPYSFDKALFFQIVIELILPVWIALVLFFPKYRPKFNLLSVSIPAYLGILFIAGLFGYDFLKSFWGYEERMNGIFTLLHFFAFYLMALSVFREESKKKFILFWALAIGAIVSFFGIAEHYSMAVREFFGNDGRSASLFGNPIVLAAYALSHLFLAFYLCGHYWKIKLARYFTIISSVVCLLAIYFSGTRGAMVGALVGIAAVVLFAIARKILENRNQKIFFSFVLALGFAGLIFASLAGNRIAGFAPESISKKIIAGTGETRLMLWDIAIKGIAERSLLGWGPENFDLIYDKYYNPKFLDFSFYETWSDRAHNTVLDILATSGILGFIAYIFIFGSAIYLIMKKEITFGSLAVMGGLVAYFTQNIFTFDSPPGLLGLFLLLALSADNCGRESNYGKFSKNIKIAVCVIFSGLSLGSLIFLNIRPAIASNFALKSMNTFGINPDAGAEYFRKSQAIWSPYRDSARVKFANAVYFAANSGTMTQAQKAEFISLAISEILKSSAARPHDFSFYFLLGNLYAAKGDYGASDYNYGKALELSPARQAIFFQRASAKFLEGKDSEAIAVLEQAVRLDESARMPHWRLGLGLIGMDNNRAIAESIKAVELGYAPQSFEEINAFASIFAEDEKWSELVAWYELLIKSEVASADIYAQLALAYAQTGNKEMAIYSALKAVELDPSFEPEADAFIKSLK